ncbi:MAG: hypothetical protein KAI43_00430 [Candidatus Aureabacteria bacterium]|nr:hypothetical protein [Candidatus Auribacterota bacterium]
MINRRFFSVVCFFVFYILFSNSGFSKTSSKEGIPQTSYQAKVVDISGEKYYPSVLQQIGQAKESIYMVMFLISYEPNVQDSPVAILLNELIKARQRGVDITVILDRNVDYKIKDYTKSFSLERKNIWAFQKLKEADINVYYDDLYTYTHAKTLIIDKESIITGSANWSRSAFQKNIEINFLIRSKQLAEELTKDVNKIKKFKASGIFPFSKKNAIRISRAFIDDPSFASLMMTNHSKRAFDIYLFLLKELGSNDQGKIILDYEKLAHSLGVYSEKNRTGYRRKINRELRKLQKTFSLIRFEPHHSKEAVITLLNYNDPEKPYAVPQKNFFIIPASYWEYGLQKHLSLRAQFCYLINLFMLSVSDIPPVWSSGRGSLSKRFHIDKWTISKGMGELRRHNLIDIKYMSPVGEIYSYSFPNHYVFLPLYDPEKLEKHMIKLQKTYGIKKLRKARKYAAIVFKENDPIVVKEIILMMNVYSEPVKKAFNIVNKKRISNPKRSYAYVRGIIDNLTKK